MIGQEREDRAGRLDADQVGEPAPLEHGDGDAHRRGQRQQAGQRPGRRHQDRPEQHDEGQEAEADDDEQEPRQRVRQHLGEVGRHGLEAADVRLRAGVGRRRGDDVLAQVEQQVGRRLVLRGGRRDTPGSAATVASSATGAAAARATPGSSFSASVSVGDRVLVAGLGQLDGDVERSVDAGAEALGGQVVGDPRRAALGRAPSRRRSPSRSDSIGSAITSMTTRAKAAGQPRPLLQPVAVPGEGAGPVRVGGLAAVDDPAPRQPDQRDREVRAPSRGSGRTGRPRAGRRSAAAGGSPRSSVTHAIRPTNAQVPSSDSTAGSSSSAPSITMNTVMADATAMPLKKVICMHEQARAAR